jgi:hypothetical protein
VIIAMTTPSTASGTDMSAHPALGKAAANPGASETFLAAGFGWIIPAGTSLNEASGAADIGTLVEAI